MSVLMLGSITIVAMVNNSITFIYYLAIEATCLAIVATVIHAAFPVHVTDAVEIDEAHLVDGLMPSAFLLAIAIANQSAIGQLILTWCEHRFDSAQSCPG